MARYIVAALVALVTVSVMAQEARPWDTWQPPEVTLPQPNGFGTYLKAFELKQKVDAEWAPVDVPPGPPPDAPPAARPGAPPPPPAPPPGAPGEPAAPPAPPPGPRVVQDQWGEGPPDLPLPERVGMYAEVLALVREAMAQETRIPPMRSYGEQLPYFRDFRAVARLLVMEAEVRWQQEGAAAGAASALDALEMAQDPPTQRSLIGYLVGRACEAIALATLDRVIPALTAQESRQALLRLREIAEKRVPFADVLAEEEILNRGAFKEFFATPETMRWGFEVMGAGDPAELTAEKVQALYDNLPRSWEAITPYYDRAKANLGLPYIQQEDLEPEDEVLMMLAPRMGRIFFREAASRTALALREALLAAEAYCLEQGHAPEPLAALVPELLPAVPVDPFDGQPLRMKVLNGQTVIYSVGPDGVDDGGQPVEGRAGFVTPEARGDVVVKVGGL